MFYAVLFPEVLVPALPSSVIEPVWDQFVVLIPEHIDTHPLGCHNPRILDRTVFDKIEAWTTHRWDDRPARRP